MTISPHALSSSPTQWKLTSLMPELRLEVVVVVVRAAMITDELDENRRVKSARLRRLLEVEVPVAVLVVVVGGLRLVVLGKLVPGPTSEDGVVLTLLRLRSVG